MSKTTYNYKLLQSQIAKTRMLFETKLQLELNLIRVSAPLIVTQDSGLNDRLSGVENAVNFYVNDLHKNIEIVQSLAKWKRVAIKRYNIPLYEGLYTDMNAIRKDEILDPIHSVYVDQWDWEVHITKQDRTTDVLVKYAESVYAAIYETKNKMQAEFNLTANTLPAKLYIISSTKLQELYPDLTPEKREYEIAKKHGAVFIMGIGWLLGDGKPHGSRSPDYDDWNLNGDIILWNSVLQIPFEISSMGIRVDEVSIVKQLTTRNDLDCMKYQYHQDIINKQLPYTIGGGIGQSRLCMFVLGCKHIGEVQCSVWADDVLKNDDWNIL